MPTNVKVCINGFVLSTLLFDCNNSSCDQEGFLYGSVTRNVRREISDQSMSTSQEEILISICSSVPSGSFLSFYNNVGEIKRDDLEYNLGERAECLLIDDQKPGAGRNIVGWYRFRRYSPMFPSVREMSTTKHLREVFSSYSNVDTSYFVFGILNSSNLPNFATHSYDYGFFIQKRDGSFRDLPLTILNLGDTRNSYRSGSMALPFMNSTSFNSVLASSWNFNSFFDTENQIHQFHQRLRKKLESLQEELAASDAVNASLEDDIKRISNEMQTLLATQERLASAAREIEMAETNAAAVLEISEANVIAEQLELAGADMTVSAEVVVSEAGNIVEAYLDENIEVSEKGAVDANEKEVLVSSKQSLESGDNIKLNMEVISDKSSELNKLNKIGQENSTIGDFTASQEQRNEPMDLNDVDQPNGSKDITVSSSSLKRSSDGDVSTTKRTCSDKYFESGEYVDVKSATSTADEVSLVQQKQNTVCSSQALQANKDELSPRNIEVTACDEEEGAVPSPSSTVEIIISDTGLQNYESGMIVDESTTSSEELSDIKESDAKESPFYFEMTTLPSSMTKSVSDGALCHKEVVFTRCGSAPVTFLSQVTESSEEDKLNIERISPTASSVDGSSAIANPPFIIYASKEGEDKPKEPTSPISSDRHQTVDGSLPVDSSTDIPEGGRKEILIPVNTQEGENENASECSGEKKD